MPGTRNGKGRTKEGAAKKHDDANLASGLEMVREMCGAGENAVCGERGE